MEKVRQRGKRLHGGCSDRKKANYAAHPAIQEKHKKDKMKRICRRLEKASKKKGRNYKYKIATVRPKGIEIFNIVRAS